MKGIRRLRRRQGDHALLEGPHLLREALTAGLAFETVLAAPGFLRSAVGAELAARLPRPPLEVAEELLAELCDAEAPRGLLALASLPRHGVESVELRETAILLFLDGVQDPGNLGALARVAEAFGAAALLLAPGSCHPNHPRALRASAGSLLRLPVAVEATPESFEGRCRDAGLRPRWIGLDAHGGGPLPPTRPSGVLVLALGAERGGLSAAAQARLDERWTIRLQPPVESLNVAVAAGVTLFSLTRSDARWP